MASNTKDTKKNVTGLDQAIDRKAAEYDLTAALLKAAAFKTSEENITEVNITRNGEFLFPLHIHPLSDEDIDLANKKATKYAPHPQGKRYGKIQVGFNKPLSKSWLIYLATTEEDQQLIWGNPALKAIGVMQPVDAIDKLLMSGDKNKLLNEIATISNIDDDDFADDEDENEDENEGVEEMDPETFQP